jgi:NADPH2:quinone reductase
VEVASDANIALDAELLAPSASLAAYATAEPSPAIAFWLLGFKNVRRFFLGSDDFPAESKAAAAEASNVAFKCGGPSFQSDRRSPLSTIAEAHDYPEQRRGSGRIVVIIGG